ncbi:putative bifunctional diguanylate cyclase/phosphodiesterase [Sphingomonas desiccabilis]|uniref:Sensor domain-containing phosphodiesterase n=1 Tax=Sphingomonas desiccabilis TaxID=429134 RepID=A0A4Q2IYZ9_9SPHN|nr:GGDEF and EAL domain-containing protein [Sphingomonas desiccabilis]MBB3909474.1 EAL domain-containing protein (putative c-di-GMP-specific phosphodiesterase class I) [Sphingomonas desiccabilis]RXZ34212.1 sensor domain-containing phosphodiesterase [Sphingomonas desiccabilis]
MGDISESARLDALRQLDLLDTPASESFDRITRMASQIFGLPIAAVSLTDKDRQWFKSRVGVAHQSIPRDRAPCAEVAERREPVVVEDIRADAFYAQSVLAGTGARFYAGAPLITREGHGLGALCVIGVEPRTATELEMSALRDLAAMVMAQIELQHAFGRVDPISKLANRNQFLDDLADLERDTPGEQRVAVLVDLARTDQIDGIVRVLGSGHLDQLVREAARTVRERLERSTLYHVAATQFAFVLPPDYDAEQGVALLTARLAEARATSSSRFVTTSVIGVVPFMAGSTAPADVLRTLHGAAQDARLQESGVSIHSYRVDDAHQRRFRLLQDFGEALEQPDGQLRIVVQPRVALATGRCVAAEALLRWRHPELGEIAPGEFVPIIEQSAAVRGLTEWVLHRALAQLAEWQREGVRIPLSINVSASNLEEGNFAERVVEALRAHDVAPEMIELEVTESAAMKHAGRAVEQLRRLSAAGITLAIDDFGTGYSSLAYLQQLPVDVIKIDQSFIRAMDAGEREQALVRSMVAVGEALRCRVVAEGIESEGAAELLHAMGCDEGQGYHFSRPLPVEAFAAWITQAGTELTRPHADT